jgi:HD superfamily phosphodiesterase
MGIPEVWARAEEHFAQRQDTDMRSHAEGVVKWAQALMKEGERGEPEVAIPAAILHDVGIPRAIALYGSPGPPGQEVEGAVVAREILTELNWQPRRIEAICGIIAVHHHQLAHPTPEFRLIYDADLLVNAQEAGHTYEQVADRFYSAAARRLAKEVFRAAGRP